MKKVIPALAILRLFLPSMNDCFGQDSCSRSEEKVSELEMIECCERAQQALSQAKRRQSNDNHRSNTFHNNVKVSMLMDGLIVKRKNLNLK